MHRAELCTTESDGRIRCHACAFRCLLRPGDVGRCGVRIYRKGGDDHEPGLYLAVYGVLSAIHVDPVEKKPLYHFLPGSRVFSIGTIGCNFRCGFCQNFSLSQVSFGIADEVVGVGGDIEDLGTALGGSGRVVTAAEVVRAAQHYRCDVIAYTYNEPSIWGEFACAVAAAARDAGIASVYVSNGYLTPEHLDYIAPYVSALNIDLKAWSKEFYAKICSASNVRVRECIVAALERGFHVEVTTLVVPGKNDSEEELTLVAEWLASLSTDLIWHISAFHGDYMMADVPDTPPDTLMKAREIGLRAGLRFIYCGNIRSADLSATDCPDCKRRVVDRIPATRVHVEDGVCECGTRIPGVWKKPVPVPGPDHLSVDMQAAGVPHEKLVEARDATAAHVQEVGIWSDKKVTQPDA